MFHCAACERDFVSKSENPKSCKWCHSTLWRWKPGDTIENAPRNVLETMITKYVCEYISDEERTIIDIYRIDDNYEKPNPEWTKITPNKRRILIARVIERIDPSLRRGTQHDGKTLSRLFYRQKKPA